ncbi:MAG: hypothetical protein P8R04_05725 [Gammaproteobacteria bacterium]|nr:hypothetical protein [Gammaproteobacteria bacterium]
MTEVSNQGSGNGGVMALLYRPPWVGLLAFIIVLVTQGLGHTVMIVMEDVWPGEHYIYESAFAMGLVGAVILFIGMRSQNEVTATWLGFWAGTFLWTGWVEFAFVWSGEFLNVPDLMDPNMAGEIATKAEYLVMMSSVGVLGATLVYFLLNPETKCNFFLWIQRNLKMKVGKPTKGFKRNFAAITALETIYVIWFFYLVLLFLYNEDIAGEKSIAAYTFFFFNTIWAVYLFQRLMKFWKVTTAIRYGIPTAIIAWNTVELMGRWNIFVSFWEKPQDYALEMSLFTIAIIIAAILAVKTPSRQKSQLSREELAG